MKLSEHVTIAEFEYSETAINYGIPNKMDSTQTQKAKLLCENVFEKIRMHLGKPIKINSGFRSLALNKRMKGAKGSQHCLAEAMDLNIQDRTVFDWIKNNVEFDQLIAEHPTKDGLSWIHISYRHNNNRKQVLVAKKIKGKTIYIPYNTEKDLLY